MPNFIDYISPVGAELYGKTPAGLPGFIVNENRYPLIAWGIGDSTTHANDETSYFEIACLKLGLSVGGNAGVAGNTSTQMAARIVADVCSKNPTPSIVFISGCVNNAGNSISVAQTVIDYTSMVSEVRKIGAIPIIVAPAPYTSAPNSLAPYINALHTLAINVGCWWVDPWEDCVDAATGSYIDATYTGDGTHPSPKCNRIAGTALATKLAKLLISNVRLPRYNADNTGRITNCCFLTNTVPETPDGWSGSGESVTSGLTTNDAAIVGNWWDITFTDIAAYALWSFSAGLGSIVPGDTVLAVARLKTSGLEANGMSDAQGRGKVEVSIVLNWAGANGSPMLRPIACDVASGIISRIITVPSDATNLTVQIFVYPYAQSSGSISLAQFNIYKL